MNDKLKKILAGAGLLAAFGLGGAAIAGAQGDKSAGKTGSAQSEPNEKSEGNDRHEGDEKNEAGDKSEGNETDQKVTGADADRAGQAALKSVGSGKVLSVEKERPEQGADQREPGEKPDSAKEQAVDQKTAYSVEVKKSDGNTVDVTLDDAFKVLASEQDNEGAGER